MSAILLEIENHIARITLNAPEKCNAFDNHLIRELLSTLQTIAASDQIRIVQLCAAGTHFSAGADLKWMQAMRNYSEHENKQDALLLGQLLFQLYNMPQITIAVVNGSAFGGGVGLIAACDFKIAVETATFCFSEVKLGLIPAVISPYVIRAIGSSFAKRYFMSAEIFSAETAMQMGLITEITTTSQLTEKINNWTQRLISNGPLAMRQAKQLVDEIMFAPLNESTLTHTANWIAALRVSDEGRAGIDAFLTKQNPPWVTAISQGKKI